jgi:adenylate cyclase
MSADEVVDTSRNPSTLGRRRLWLRIGVPIGGAVSVIVAILAIALYSYWANRAGVEGLSDDLLDALRGRITQEVTSYLDPAIRATRLVHDVVARNALTDRFAALESFASSALRQIPQIDALYSGDSNGDFMMVRRTEAGGTDAKLIDNAPDSRVVEFIQRDAAGRVTQSQRDLDDKFDPRTRDWYQGALRTDDVYWTDLYTFFTSGEPGITAALRLPDLEDANRVFGVDITLKALSNFLASLKIGRNGRAVIIDDDGHLIAAANASALLGGRPATSRLSDLDDPMLASAYDRFRVEGYGRYVIKSGGARIVAMASRLPSAGQDWTLLIVVPEKDFTGFVARNEQKTLWLSLLVIVLTAGLATLLLRQGLRADKAARLLLDRGDAIERQSSVFANLARQVDLFDRSNDTPLQALTTTLGDLARARRISVWRLTDGARFLQCEDAYECDVGGHVAGSRLSRGELPRFFAALESGDAFQALNAASDSRTSDFYQALMRDIDCRGVHVVPVRGAKTVVGAIVVEDGAEMSNAREFAALFASVLANRMADGAAGAPTPERPRRQAKPAAAAERSLDADLVRHEVSAVGLKAFDSAAVAFLKFDDGVEMAMPDPSAASSLADSAATILQEIVAKQDIPYLKMVGQNAVAAAGLTSEDTDAVARIADAAIATRERLLDLFDSAGRAPSFRIGLAAGFAVGGNIGREPRVFNLWGGAVSTAELMAETSAGPGSIQVDETAYYRLRADFLFRPRGDFYLPRRGPVQTFVLGSRQ